MTFHGPQGLPFAAIAPFPFTIEFVGFQISVLGMSNNAALEELCGPEVEEFLDSQFSRVGDAHRQARRKSRKNRRKQFNIGSNIFFISTYEEISTISMSWISDQYSPLQKMYPVTISINQSQQDESGGIQRHVLGDAARCHRPGGGNYPPRTSTFFQATDTCSQNINIHLQYIEQQLSVNQMLTHPPGSYKPISYEQMYSAVYK